MIDRRTFIKTTAAAGTAVLLNPKGVLSSYCARSSACFGVHSFIESYPDAVFIMRTDVDMKTNSDAKKQVGLDFGRSVFVLKNEGEGGVPLTHNVAIKPNITCRGKWNSSYTIEGSMGIVTDVFFVEGIIDGMKELGIQGDQFYIREVNCPEDFEDGGYWNMAGRTGADLRDLSARVGEISENDLQWIDVPDGGWFRKIPYLWPVNAPNSWLLNIAKFKAHAMGLTLCAKNLQGTIASKYQIHCRQYGYDMEIAPEHANPNAEAEILANYDRHKREGIPRWDKPGNEGGIWQETWATRCLDNNSVTHAGLHIIEGIYGRDGHFIEGPSPEGLATDYMANMIIFGKNPFHVDTIGHWLGGHEPGNFGLFHLAIERGLATILNPMNIPVYEWKPNGDAVLTPLTSFERTPLKTLYLQRNYNDQDEPSWHLVDEPYEYGPTGVDESISLNPEAFVLHQNYPNPFNASTSIQFSIPRSGSTLLEVFNGRGQIVDVLVEGYRERGYHLAVWNNQNVASGMYLYRFTFEGFSQTKKMVLVK